MRLALSMLLLAAALFAVLPARADLTQIKQEQSQLERQLKDIERQIADYERQLKTVRSEKNTLANKLKQLNAQRAKLQLQIQATKARMADTEGKLGLTKEEIAARLDRLALLRAQTSELIQELYKQDRRTFVQILLAGDSVSDFFLEVSGFEQINDRLAAVLDQVKRETISLQEQQARLEDQKREQENYFAIIKIQNQELTENIKEQDDLLRETKGKEANYQNVLSDNKKRAAEIRNRIYNLIEVGKKVTFGEAVTVATWASSQTGVRPAFLLAVLTQESNLGRNVGTCNRPNDPPSKSWKVVMKPERDHEPFKKITTALSLPIDTTPVSCPMKDAKGNQLGWGGAMGPAQFIPSTWLGYAPKIEAVTGKTANPWDMRDAFMAAALKLKNDGGAKQSGEWTAAMRYFSGSTNERYRFYGDNVVKLAEQYQADIEALK